MLPTLLQKPGLRIRRGSYSYHKVEPDTLPNIVPFRSEWNLSTVLKNESSSVAYSWSSLHLVPPQPPADESVSETENADEASSSTKFNWKVLLNPRFLVTLSSILFFDLGILAIYSVVPAFAEEQGKQYVILRTVVSNM